MFHFHFSAKIFKMKQNKHYSCCCCFQGGSQHRHRQRQRCRLRGIGSGFDPDDPKSVKSGFKGLSRSTEDATCQTDVTVHQQFENESIELFHCTIEKLLWMTSRHRQKINQMTSLNCRKLINLILMTLQSNWKASLNASVHRHLTIKNFTKQMKNISR